MGTTDFLRESPHLLDALEAKRKTLQHLSISVEIMPACAENYMLPFYEDVGCNLFRDVRHRLPNLKTIEIPLYLLVGWGTGKSKLQDVLPEGIRTIHIRPDFYLHENMPFFSTEVLAALIELVTQDDRHLGSLQRVSYEGPPNLVYGWEDYERTSFGMLFAGQDASELCHQREIALSALPPCFLPGNAIMREQWLQGATLDPDVGPIRHVWPFFNSEVFPPFMRGVH
jgi:hypothetical protein